MTPAIAPESAPARWVAERVPFFYGWVVVFLAFMSIFFTGATTWWGLPVFIGPMHDDTSWSHASILGAMAVRSLTAAVCGLALGRQMDRRGGPRLVLLAGVLIDAAALVSLRWVGSQLEFVLIYGIIGGAGSTGTRLIPSALIPKWFVARRGSAVAFSLTGGGVSALVMVPLIAVFIDAAGWREAWVYVGLIMLVVMLPLALLAVRAPEDLGLRPDNGVAPRQRPNAVTAETEVSFTLGAAARTLRFWLLLLAMIFGSYSLTTMSVIVVPYFEGIGFTAAAAASGLAVYGLFSVSSRFIWGYAADRMTTRPAIALQTTLTGLGAAFLLTVDSHLGLYAFSIYNGFMMGGFPTLQALIWPEFFGRVHIGAIIGLTQLFTTIASAAGPFIAGVLYDETGSYSTSVALLIVTWLSCAAATLVVRQAREPEPLAAAIT